jgi:hypothetical protein
VLLLLADIAAVNKKEVTIHFSTRKTRALFFLAPLKVLHVRFQGEKDSFLF